MELKSPTIREHMLKVFKNRVLRDIFRPNRQGTGGHRKLHKVELYNLYLLNIIQMIKLRGTGWAENVLHMGQGEMHK
jgi:hypothetical protein